MAADRRKAIEVVLEQRRHVVVAALVASLASALGFTACREPEDVSVAFAERDAEPTAPTPRAWGASGCAACLAAPCAEPRAWCASEPGCARALACLEACAVTDAGGPAPECASRCGPLATSGTAARDAWNAYGACRASAGPGCPACGDDLAELDPRLRQSCPNPSWDAGPDASDDRERCSRCVAERCCASRKRCLEDEPECAALRDCRLACDGAVDCIRACNAEREPQIGPLRELLTCTTIRCAEECDVPRNACVACLDASCASEQIACASSTACFLFERCIGECSGEDCASACRRTYPDGVAPYGTFLACTRERCAVCF